ncbi:hypothetical protein FY136_00800 [Agrobacterium tumefaciens]|uniref:hypothetical protein n=1 Tax=Agrobacterium tumefaciens TaxID=358 RepID=UPI0021D33952|nr:hypothetical protein [Agrobacterium tumefaciens]UXT47846.1 hypothetical protein FY136_00800 [Agrobacterium tumefaciens]
MTEFLHWPICKLTPRSVSANVTPFSRSGGRSLGGVEPSVRTDIGYWSITYDGVVIPLGDREGWRCWQAIARELGGSSGLAIVPILSAVSAPYASGGFEPQYLVSHGDGTPFSDDSKYAQDAISIRTMGTTGIGQSVMRLRIINAASDLAGVRFSFEHALYETGAIMDVDGDIVTVPVWPTVRAPIPADAELEFDRPTCLCHLASDGEMAVSQDAMARFAAPTISFVEATDYWNRLALGLV